MGDPTVSGAVIRFSTAKILESVYCIDGSIIIITNGQKSKIVFVSCSTVSCYRNVSGCVVPVAKIACQLTHNLVFMACATKFRVKIAWMDDVCVCACVCACACGVCVCVCVCLTLGVEYDAEAQPR